MIHIHDVIHYYLGSLFRFSYNNTPEVFVAKLELINKSGFMCGEVISKNWTGDDWFEINDFRKDGKIQLILTDTHDITKEQMKKYKSLCYKIVDLKDEKKIVRYADTPLSMDFLFKNSIDAFDLIETGQAIDMKEYIKFVSPT